MKAICNNNIINQFFKKNPDAYLINENGEWRCRSVHFDDDFRFNKAQEEAEKDPAPIEQVISYCNEFLSRIGVTPVANPTMDPRKISYSEIKKQYHLNDERDIVWVKFTKGKDSQPGHVGVVAQSNDINFDIPPSADVYNDKDKNQRWVYNTSGIIIHQLGKRWDTSFVLLFPLQLDNVNYSRHEIETGLGNFLIDMGVPILDYYSHNY